MREPRRQPPPRAPHLGGVRGAQENREMTKRTYLGAPNARSSGCAPPAVAQRQRQDATASPAITPVPARSSNRTPSAAR